MAQQRSGCAKNIRIETQNPRSSKQISTNATTSKRTAASLSQVPNDINGRLYLLCKTWGYLKYFNQKKCSLKWDTLLNTTIKQVLLSTNNTDFNNTLMTMFNKVGNNAHVSNPALKPDTNINFNNAWITDTVFSQPVRNFLDTFSVHIYPDNSTCFVKFNSFSNSNYTSYIDFRNDPLSLPLNYTNEADRLTAIFYYWNVIDYFHPFKHIMDQSWDSTLYAFIPLIRQASTVNNFHKTFLKMVTRINDSHGFTNSTVLTNIFWGGNYMPQIYFTRIDTNCVVTKLQNIPGVHVGDILTSMNGIAIKLLEDSLSHFLPASTPAALYRDMYSQMMLGALHSTINCTFLDSINNSYSVTLTRTIDYSTWYDWEIYNGNATSYFITTCGYGYVDMGKLQSSEVNNMYTTFQNLPAIIFDLRNYPNGTLWDLASHFFPAPIVSAEYFDPALTSSPNEFYMPGWYYQSNDSLNMGSWSNPTPYAGTVYILVNQETQSQAEYTCQYLSKHPNAKVIGTQTAGADGNVSYLTLPGGITTYFTSLGWYYADGYQQQRNGVKIDSIVSPTPAGLRHGRDEILEAVFNCASGINYPDEVKSKVSVFPDPANNMIEVSFNKFTRGELHIIDITGREVYTQNINSANARINVASLPVGYYNLAVQSGAEIIHAKLLIAR